MAKSKKQDDAKKKVPFNVLRKGLIGTLLGVTMLAGTGSVLTGCTEGAAGKDGADGVDGSTWLTGTTTPTNAQGKVGDFYYDTDDYVLYKKSATAWEVLVNNFGKPGTTVNGEDGDEVVFRTTNSAIEWKYSKEADTEYRTLVTISSITGASGDQVVLRVENGYIQWKYSEEADTEYENLVSLQTLTGGDGREVVFTADANHIKWKYANEEDTAYRNLVGISALKGDEGKSAYEIAQGAGFEGDEVAWLNSLHGNGIEEISIEYEMDNDGTMYAVYTIRYTDESKNQTIRAQLPARAQYINLYDTTYDMCEAGKEPTLKIFVQYDNGTYDNVDVTEDMFVVDEREGYEEIDFQTPGSYHVKIIYKGAYLTTNITVVDPDDTRVQSVEMWDSIIVLLDGENKIISNDYLGSEVRVSLANGEYLYVPLSDEKVSVTFDQDTFESGTEVMATVRYNGGADGEASTQMRVLPLSQQDFDTSEKDVWYNGDNQLYCEVGQNPFTSDDLIVYGINDEQESNQYCYYQQATTEMLKNGEAGFVNDKEYAQITYTFNVDGLSDNVNITVYDPNELVIKGTNNVQVPVGIDPTEYPEFGLQISAMTETVGNIYLEVPYNNNADLVITSNGGFDYNTIGTYTIKYTYKGKEGSFKFVVYDPEVCNIYSMNIEDLNRQYTYGTDFDTYLTENFIGNTLNVSYFEAIGDEYSEQVTITEDMLDLSRFNENILGYQPIGVTHTLEGQSVSYTEWFYIQVVADMEGAEEVATYSVAGLQAYAYMNEMSSFTLYNNGVAVSDDGDQLAYEIVYLGEGETDEDKDKVFKFYDTGMGGYGYFAVNEEGNALEIYTPTGMVAAKTYTTTWEVDDQNIQMSIVVYDAADEEYDENGTYYAVVKMNMGQEMEYTTVEVSASNGQMTALGRVFNIDGTTLTLAE